MNASELFKAGKLAEAIAAQTQEVKTQPADQAKRLFLFELLAFAGELDRARRQIEAVRYEDVELETAVATYAKLLDAEQARRKVFQQGATPQFLAEPPEHVRIRLAALSHLQGGRAAEAANLLAQASAGAPPVRGRLNDQPFEDLRDCDDLFGTVLEVLAHGDYYWVPLEQVVSLTMNPPKFPRDLLWVPARLEVRDGPAGDVFLAALYPLSHEHADDQIKLGRKTDWRSTDDGPVLGVGQRMFLLCDEAISLLEWRQLEIAHT